MKGAYGLFIVITGEEVSNIERVLGCKKEDEDKDNGAKKRTEPDLKTLVENFRLLRGRYKSDFQRTGFLELLYSLL